MSRKKKETKKDGDIDRVCFIQKPMQRHRSEAFLDNGRERFLRRKICFSTLDDDEEKRKLLVDSMIFKRNPFH